MTQPVILALTAGEPAGIGPELCLQLALVKPGPGIVVVASKPLLEARARLQSGSRGAWQPGREVARCEVIALGPLRLALPAFRQEHVDMC